MNDNTKDYYNMPSESIPSPCFANRLASGISDTNLTNRLWTFIISSESSSCSPGAEDGPTPRVQSAAKSLHFEPGDPQEPAIIMTGLTDDLLQPRPKSLSDANIIEGLILRKKAITVLPSAPGMLEYAPQLPRRAISVRLGPSKTIKRRTPHQENVVTDPLVARRAIEAADKTRSHGQRVQPPRSWIGNGRGHIVTDAQLPGSFSQKARVKRTLEDKNLGRLMTDIVDFESRGLLTSPTSMMDTPRELYAIAEKHSTSDEASSHELRDARLCIMSSLSGASPSLKLRRYVPARADYAKRMPPAERQQIYLPGAICLEEHPAKLRKDSVASLDPFAKAIEPRGKRFSDIIAADSITMYFEDLGVSEYATERCLDRYWLDVQQAPRHVASARKSSITKQPLKSHEKPHNEHSPQSSRFSFSSASSTASLPRSGTPMRQRDKLKRLLSPAFPSSAFLKTPADWGQQAETS
jgi:hypothetical protein